MTLKNHQLNRLAHLVATRFRPDESKTDAFFSFRQRTQNQIERVVILDALLGIKNAHKAVLGVLDKGDPTRGKTPRVFEDMGFRFDGRRFVRYDFVRRHFAIQDGDGIECFLNLLDDKSAQIFLTLDLNLELLIGPTRQKKRNYNQESCCLGVGQHHVYLRRELCALNLRRNKMKCDLSKYAVTSLDSILIGSHRISSYLLDWWILFTKVPACPLTGAYFTDEQLANILMFSHTDLQPTLRDFEKDGKEVAWTLHELAYLRMAFWSFCMSQIMQETISDTMAQDELV